MGSGVSVVAATVLAQVGAEEKYPNLSALLPSSLMWIPVIG